jgi:transglutaminase-like putative cysteine protease
VILPIALLLLLGADVGTAESPRGIIELPLRNELQQPFSNQRPLRVVLEMRPGPRVDLEDRVTLASKKDGQLELEVVGYPLPSDKVTKALRASSHLIDFDEAAVKTLRAKAVERLGKKPTVAALRDFVSKEVRYTMLRPFDSASRVAERKEGDCTELAVLLTALLRSFGVPARVVLGVVLFREGNQLKSFGHAWVEHHDGRRWAHADAAIPSTAGATYLPLDVLRNEGPSYGIAAMGSSFLRLRQITLREPAR